MKKLHTLVIALLLSVMLFACSSTCMDSIPGTFDEVLSKHFSSEEPGAAVIVAKGNKVLFRRAYGMANVEEGVPLSPEMRFRIGSLTKPFTAAAIMLLADRGQLAVTDDITKYLPDYQTQGKKVTIEHLLTHTSGIKNYTDIPAFEQSMAEDIPLHELVGLFRDEPLEFDPGSRMSYSNSGYILLGVIIEQVSGQTYSSFMKEQVLEPLGMLNTEYENLDQSKKGRLVGYNRNEVASPISMSQVYSAGALVSTIDDLVRWNAAITSGELLTPRAWKRVFTPYILKNGQASKTGYGWGIGKIKGHSAVGHEGKINGFSSVMIRLPEEEVFVAVLSNNDRLHLFNAIESALTDTGPACMASQLAIVAVETKL